ncbi:MAG: DUF305 domain-containing protein [Ignavibacteriales bacterium]|nr:DUF305 domain-containing protein [Ignavibacteriales bacterium]
MKTTLATLIIILLASFLFMPGCVNKDNNSKIQQHDTTATLTKTTDMNNMGMMQSMNKMNYKMTEMKMTGDYDYDYAKMMIEHHRGAIEMSEIELTAGTEAKMKAMALNIITVQKDEILKMDEFIKKHSAVKSNYKMGTMDSMDENFKKIKMTGNTDKDFAMMMIKHHEIAVTMAKGEVSNGKFSVMKNMAQQTIVNQNKEIKEFQSWLDNIK